MGFYSVKQFAEAEENGRTFVSHFRKNIITNNNPWWQDLSLIGGGPPANYYASSPLVAATLDGNAGFYIGDNKSPASRWLTHWGLVANTAVSRAEYMLCDYLMYYPFIDCDDTTTQAFTNSVTLPRFTDGDGVRVAAICVSPGVGGGRFTFEYVNQSGAAKTSPTINCISVSQAPVLGTILSAAGASSTNLTPFCALASGDTGVRSITSVTFSVANGGLMCLCLMKPVASNAIWEASTMSEKEFVTRSPGPPRVYDGAYLNMLCAPTTSMINTGLTGYLRFAWDEGV